MTQGTLQPLISSRARYADARRHYASAAVSVGPGSASVSGCARSACLVRVTAQQTDIDHAIDYARRHSKSPLREIALGQLLLAQRTQVASSRRQLALASELLGIGSDLEKQTIGWLVDGRSGGRRLATRRDAGLPREVGQGFPMRGGI